VLSLRGFPLDLRSLWNQWYLKTEVGQQVYKTSHTRILVPRFRNEKFTFNFTHSDEINVRLYKKTPFRKEISNGSVTIPIELEPRNQDLVKSFPSSNKRKPMSFTYQLREPEINLRDISRCRVFALIIGINEYLSDTIPDLQGCVHDAQTFRLYLVNRYHVPEEQIVSLINQDATRHHILRVFHQHLVENPAIEKDDTIVVYYAGHGSQVEAPRLWPSSDGKVETIVPYDERSEIGGDAVHGIPDYTLNVLLGKLASAKGNNITVILDCCHSASGTRTVTDPSILPLPRFVETSLPIPENLDEDIVSDFGGRHSGVMLPTGTSHNFMDSHVLLAACRKEQRARECLAATGEVCGFFTNGLIKQLRRVGPNQITYTDLIDLLPTLPDQNPQCEGGMKGRYLFGVEGPARELRTYTLTVKDGAMTVNAGSIHGVVIGTQFTIKADDSEEASHGRIILIAESVNMDSSVLVPMAPELAWEGVHDKARLVVADWNNDAAVMKVYIYTSRNPSLAVSDVYRDGNGSNFLVVDSEEIADLTLERTIDGAFALTRLDAKLSHYGLPEVRLTAPTAQLHLVLESVAHFNYFLNKRPWHGNPLIENGAVQLEMYSLLGEYGSRVPDMGQGNLVGAENQVYFELDPQGRYGFAICNYSDRDLFPYLFYFDPASYSIDAWYVPESKTMAPPLRRKVGSQSEPTRITVGYGASGGYAFQFVLPPGVGRDTGFLKLFVSTSYIDLGRVPQPTVQDIVSAELGGRGPEKQEAWPRLQEAETWGALEVAVTMYMDQDQDEDTEEDEDDDEDDESSRL
ncbi:caspase domain-containing protein, partial [Favolaschia claudopus]